MGKTASLANIGTIADSSLGFRNRIINGACVIDQRNAGASVGTSTLVSADLYSLDRWVASGTQNSKFTIQQTPSATETGYATRVSAGFTNYLAITSSSAYSVGTSDFFTITQRIEGYNIADLAWGTSSAATVTLSFWVRSSLTGTFGGTLMNNAGTQSYPFTYTISAANTWEQKSITIAGSTSGTWVATNGRGIQVQFGLGAGASVSAAAGSWAGGAYYSATGATSVVGTNGATFYITGVQLEKGSTATSFDYRPIGTELALCQRYLPAFNSISTASYIATGFVSSTISGVAIVPFAVTARTAPTGITVSNGTHFGFQQGNSVYTSTSMQFTSGSIYQGTIILATTGLTTNSGGAIYFNNASGQLLFTGCEL